MRDAGEWGTRAYPVQLSDGSTRSVYASSSEDAHERMRRHLARLPEDLRAGRTVLERPRDE